MTIKNDFFKDKYKQIKMLLQWSVVVLQSQIKLRADNTHFYSIMANHQGDLVVSIARGHDYEWLVIGQKGQRPDKGNDLDNEVDENN